MDLQTGIFLEDRNILLPWGVTKKQAWKTGSPVEYDEDDDTRILWKNVIVLNGIKADLLAWFPEKKSILKEISVLIPESDNIQDSIQNRKWMAMITKHLNKHLGLPSDYLYRLLNIQSDIGRPMFTWKIGKIKISQICDLRFTESFWLDIKLDKK